MSGDWEEAPAPNRFIAMFGAMQRLRAGDRCVYRLRVEERHLNEAGIMHGGAMTALIDEAAGTIISETLGRKHVTVHLATSFLKPAQLGDFVEASCDIVRATRSMSFVEAKLRVGQEVVASASLTFKAVRPTGE